MAKHPKPEELATAQSERDRVISERKQAEQAVQKLASDRDGATSAVEALQRRQADAQAQLATLTDTLATRNKEMATLEDRIGTTRQELAAAQAKLAEARQQLSDQPPAMTVHPSRNLLPSRPSPNEFSGTRVGGSLNLGWGQPPRRLILFIRRAGNGHGATDLRAGKRRPDRWMSVRGVTDGPGGSLLQPVPR